ncbi:Crp/Fnr family transcriptional regulator [bacterium]|nr:Crp/Fnr family transcriptional regulator [bacterium]
MKQPLWKTKEKDTAMLYAKGEVCGVCPKLFKEIINRCEYMEIGKGEEFIYQGKPNNDIYILIKGIACSTYCVANKEIITQFFHPQRNILMFNSPVSETGIITNEGFEGICKTSMLRLSKQVLEELIIQYPILNNHISNNYNWQQHENRMHANSLHMHTPQQKIIYFYTKHPSLYDNHSLTAIRKGEHLNVSDNQFCIHKNMVKARGYLN